MRCGVGASWSALVDETLTCASRRAIARLLVRLEPHKPQDDVAVALARPAHGREPVDHGRLKPRGTNFALCPPNAPLQVVERREQIRIKKFLDSGSRRKF